jgi:hypothetical protein
MDREPGDPMRESHATGSDPISRMALNVRIVATFVLCRRSGMAREAFAPSASRTNIAARYRPCCIATAGASSASGLMRVSGLIARINTFGCPAALRSKHDHSAWVRTPVPLLSPVVKPSPRCPGARFQLERSRQFELPPTHPRHAARRSNSTPRRTRSRAPGALPGGSENDGAAECVPARPESPLADFASMDRKSLLW